MNASRRPPRKSDPRKVADGAARALREPYGEPVEGNFVDGVAAHVEYRRRMCPETEGACDLGPYVASRQIANDGERSVHLEDEPPQTIRFPAWWRRWFAAQTERGLHLLSRLVDWLGEHGDVDADIKLATLNRIIDREKRREARRAAFKAYWKIAAAAGGFAYTAVHYGGAIATWIAEHAPMLRSVFKLLMESGS